MKKLKKMLPLGWGLTLISTAFLVGAFIEDVGVTHPAYVSGWIEVAIVAVIPGWFYCMGRMDGK